MKRKEQNSEKKNLVIYFSQQKNNKLKKKMERGKEENPLSKRIWKTFEDLKEIEEKNQIIKTV